MLVAANRGAEALSTIDAALKERPKDSELIQSMIELTEKGDFTGARKLHAWLLPLICRRGAVTRKEVGAMAAVLDGRVLGKPGDHPAALDQLLADPLNAGVAG